jgi:Ca-activated chloride channel family protein
MLYLLLLIPAMAGVFVFTVRSQRRRMERFGQHTTLVQLIPEASPRRVRNKFILLLCAMGCIVLALARPQFGSKLKEVTREGIELMFVVDVSNSMLAEDFEPSRLERTKYAITSMLEGLDQDKVGLVVFAGDPYVQLPITSDYRAARNFVGQISPNLVSRQGTAIGAAISLAAGSFSSQSEGSRVIVLISDGENHEDDALGAAAEAAQKGIKIYAIGIGTPEGAPISIGGEFIKDEEGNMVVTKLDEQVLQQVAVSTGGGYIRATNQNMGLTEIIKEVNETQSTQFTASVFEEYDEQYQYLVGAALALLLLEMLMIPRKNRILARFNIFRSGKGQR